MDVRGPIVSATVTQKFENAFSERIEATYVFPLPNDAAVDSMEMRIGERVVRADVQRRAQAQATYEDARRNGRRAALLEQERPNIFTFHIANIDPHKSIEVRTHYFATAKYDASTYELALPLVVGPRYVPGEGSGSAGVPDASKIATTYLPPNSRDGSALGLSVHLDGGGELELIESPTHAVDVNKTSSAVAEVALQSRKEVPNRDFVLRWKLKAKELGASVFAYRPSASEDGYLAVVLEPKHDIQVSELAARELVFLLDTSGSMNGPPIQAAIAAAERAIDSMQSSDTFQIIDFADTASTFAPEPLANTVENRRRAHEYLRHLNASGGTNQLVGIHAALSAKSDSQRLRYVVFMTDGYIGNDDEVIGLVQKEVGANRIFGFGVGAAPNRYLLDEVSAVGRGHAEYIRPREDSKPIVERLYSRIGKPYLTDVEVNWGTLGVTQVVPARIPDVSALEPLVLYGRYKGSGKTTIELKGRVAMRPFTKTIAVDLPASTEKGSAVGRLWARARIDEISRQIHVEGETAPLVGSITSLALEQHLVTKYTSLIAVDSLLGNIGDGRPPVLVSQPANAPQDVDLPAAGGQYAPPADALPSPPSATGNETLALAPGHHGCAGCTLGGAEDGTPGAFGLVGIGLLVALRRRR
jgi:Ca-activated chloride channel family protein